MRRVVIGHNASGASVVTSDEAVPSEELPGIGALAKLWSADQPALYPDDGRNPGAPGLFPPVGGFRVVVAEYPPGQRIGHSEGDESGVAWEDDGMHRTDTTDVSIVLEGEIALALDDGSEVTLRQGDVTIVAGARHAWRNAGSGSAKVMFVLVGARRVGTTGTA